MQQLIGSVVLIAEGSSQPSRLDLSVICTLSKRNIGSSNDGKKSNSNNNISDRNNIV